MPVSRAISHGLMTRVRARYTAIILIIFCHRVFQVIVRMKFISAVRVIAQGGKAAPPSPETSA